MEAENENQPKQIFGNTTEEEAAIRQCVSWYEVDKEAKQFYNDEMREMYKLYKGDHWNLLGVNGNPLRTAAQQQNRPNSVENVTFALVEGTASEFSNDVELVDFPVEEGDDDAAQVMSELKKFIFYKNNIAHERVKMLRWFFLYGTLIWHVYWDPEWRGGKGPNRWEGDIRWKAMHPLGLIPDARCMENVNEGRRCHKIAWQPLESVKEKYPDRAHLIQWQTQDPDEFLDQDQADSEGFSAGYGDDDAEMVPVIETWYIGKPLIGDDEGLGLHVIWWAGEDQGVYLRHENYIYFEPGETPQFPFFVKQCYPRENSIWGFGEAYFLKNPQTVRNKTAEIILESHLHNSIGQTFYNDRALTPEQQEAVRNKGTLPGMWYSVHDIQGIRREHARNVPGSLQNEMDRLQNLMESIIGRFDVSQGKTPGGVTAFRAIAELSARAQVRLRIKESAITSAYEEAGQFCNRLISQFYTERRRYRIRGKKDELTHNTYNIEDMLRVYDGETQDVTPLSNAGGVEALEGLDHDRYEVYFPEFDTICRVTSVMPSDRVYHMDIAKELLSGGVIDIETFLEVMDTGRFPPAGLVLQRMEQKKQEAMAMQMMMQGGGMPQEAGPPGMPPQPGGEMPPQMPPEAMTPPGQAQPAPVQGGLSPEVRGVLESYPPGIRDILSQYPEEELMEFLSQPVGVQLEALQKLVDSQKVS